MASSEKPVCIKHSNENVFSLEFLKKKYKRAVCYALENLLLGMCSDIQNTILIMPTSPLVLFYYVK